MDAEDGTEAAGPRLPGVKKVNATPCVGSSIDAVSHPHFTRQQRA